MRGADGGKFESVCALSSFWVGLLYDQISLDSSWDLIKDFDVDKIQDLRLQIVKNGLKSSFGNSTVLSLVTSVLNLSNEGLKRRNVFNGNGQDESIFLNPLRKIIETERTPSDELVKKFLEDWDKDLVNMYKEYTF